MQTNIDQITKVLLNILIPIGIGLGFLLQWKFFYEESLKRSKYKGKTQRILLKICIFLIGAGGIIAGVTSLIAMILNK